LPPVPVRARLPAALPKRPRPTGHRCARARAHQPTLLHLADLIDPRACPPAPLPNARSRSRSRAGAPPAGGPPTRPPSTTQLPAPRAAPPTAPTRPANWPPPSPNRAPPARLPPGRPPASPPRPFPPSSPLPVLAPRRRPPGPHTYTYTAGRARLTPLDRTPARAAPCLPARPSGRARLRRPFFYTYPPTSTGPQSCVQTFRGPKCVPGEAHFRWPTARLSRGHVPRPTGHRPSSAGGRARAPKPTRLGLA
jgi:hypothetical protein